MAPLLFQYRDALDVFGIEFLEFGRLVADHAVDNDHRGTHAADVDVRGETARHTAGLTDSQTRNLTGQCDGQRRTFGRKNLLV